MQDIYLSEKRGKSKKKSAPRPWSGFLFNLVCKSLIIISLLSIDFILFANAGSYGIFQENHQISPEFLYVLAGISIFSVSIIFLFSFSYSLQNLIVTLLFSCIALAFLNQFALFNKDAMLYGLISNYFGADTGNLFMHGSHYIVIGALAIVLFGLLSFSSRATQAYFTGILLLIGIGVGTDTYFSAQKNGKDFRVTHQTKPQAIANSNAKYFIYIGLPELGTLNQSDAWANNKFLTGETLAQIEQSHKNQLGFYSLNRFVLYPNAYVREENPFLNIVQTLNPGTLPEDIGNNLLNLVSLNSLWNFDDLSNQYLYLKNNQLFNSFKKAKYNISVYQSRGLELCSNQLDSINKCVKKQNLPINLDALNLSPFAKTEFLVAEWLESSGLFTNLGFVYEGLKPFVKVKETPLLGYSTNNFYVVNSLKTLDIIAEDIEKDKSSHAFFAFVDMPSNAYIYDEFCHVKPAREWVYQQDQDWVKQQDMNHLVKAYNQQVSCLYGKLKEFLQKLQQEGILDKSVIVLQSLNSRNNRLGIRNDDDFIENFKNNNQALLAIRDPFKKESEINDKLCLASNIIKEYLFKAPQCAELKELNLHDLAKGQLLSQIKAETIKKENLALSVAPFQKWYEEWVQKNPASDIKLKELQQNSFEKIKKETIDNFFNGKPTLTEEGQKDMEKEIKAFSEAVNTEEAEEIEPEVSVKVIEGNKIEEITASPTEEVKEIKPVPVSAEEEAEPETEVIETPQEITIASPTPIEVKPDEMPQ